MTSMVMPSWKSGSMRPSTLASCNGVCTCPSMRCISVRNTASNGLCRLLILRSTISSQSPTVITAIIGCSLPWIRVLLSSKAKTTVVEPKLSVASKASLSNGTGPLYASWGEGLLLGTSWYMPRSSQYLRSSRGNREASMPNSSTCDTPSATPRIIGDSKHTSASLWPSLSFTGCVFWYERALKQRGLFLWYCSAKCCSRRCN
mmetsp:Transcript_7969/g.16711  ORF Transcript_7969/g.16711 Transcript_7969/m.16711 type:complete len:203 (-) Transcript_7969:139-747(-)